jgi:GMP synthase (glutamine-hydrolysing)
MNRKGGENVKMFYPKDFIQKQVQIVKERVGDGKAVVTVSGGLDSTVCAVLTQRAVGNRALGVFINDGLMREGEAESIITLLKGMNVNTKVVDAAPAFAQALNGITEDEEKRKVFRDAFYAALARTIREENVHCLVLGTTLVDVVETEGGTEVEHDVFDELGIDPGSYKLAIVEPLKELYNHEVKEVARFLGMPTGAFVRPPFPVVLDLIRKDLVK